MENCGLFYSFKLPYVIFIFIAIAVLKGPGRLFQGLNGSEEPFLEERLMAFAKNGRNLVSLFFAIPATVCFLIFLPTPRVFEFLPFIAVAILGGIACPCQLPQVWPLALLYLLLVWVANVHDNGVFMGFILPGIVFILLSIALRLRSKLQIFAKKLFGAAFFVYYLLLSIWRQFAIIPPMISLHLLGIPL
jgi:hypothetical protein